ncbi:hypothetical protein [Anthocerotibacter panamensis]|uniref:hypothetical protein n=1 Tax=Anthocerotibacter panamensis TaxID=2857077 RepID=UPI001C4077C1|nr:hypothetical protein [Anthocerotibacter panamensis]
MKRLHLVGLLCALTLLHWAPQAQAEETAQVITLTQTPCQFLETEARDNKYVSKSGEDCKRINQATTEKRQLKTLTLKPGKTVFRVTNVNVPYELGFYLRGHGLGFVTLPKVSGGGLTVGKTQDYEIDLKPGEYDFSCPLNPTPDYKLVVKG